MRDSRIASTEKHIVVMIPYSFDFGRRMLKGVYQYSLARPHLVLHRELDELPLERLDFGHWRVDGVIAHASLASLADSLATLDIPAVSTSPVLKTSPIPRICVDSNAIGKLAATHFLERGYRSCAYLGAGDLQYVYDRGEAFTAALARVGINCAQYHHQIRVDEEQPGATNDLSHPIARWAAKLPLPCAVFTDTDRTALFFSEVCRCIGLRVPDEIAILGVDNDEVICNLSYPPLSSVNTPAERIGYEAARLIDHLMSGGIVPQESRLLPPLGIVTRQSTEMQAIADEYVRQALGFIAVHAHQHMSMNDVLDAVPLSRRALEQRFHDLLGSTIHQEILRVQVRRVQRLLAETPLSVEQIATASGFLNPKHMARVFREALNMTPSQYRAANQGGPAGYE